jgi:hypothetical protein
MQIFALFMLLGFFLSWLIPETNGKTLEELSGENDEKDLREQFEANAAERKEEELDSERNPMSKAGAASNSAQLVESAA